MELLRGEKEIIVGCVHSRRIPLPPRQVRVIKLVDPGGTNIYVTPQVAVDISRFSSLGPKWSRFQMIASLDSYRVSG